MKARDSMFTMNANYLIADNATSSALLEDALALSEPALEIVNTLAIELGDKGSQTTANPEAAARMLWGAFNMLSMAQNITTAALSRMNAAESAKVEG
ncbi:hypothetical protein [Solimonas soli]|uniref:hypothetical protein n=1 Tax=Solimonas soli TaxID=413479 RepID=UPI000483D7D5|nr:hypothetical protein [Solimonas soli]